MVAIASSAAAAPPKPSSRSATTRCFSRSESGLPCQPGSASNDGHPRIMRVCQITTDGLPFQRFALCSATSISWKSWPHASITFQPNAANLSASGSIDMTSCVQPSICASFLSTSSERLSRW